MAAGIRVAVTELEFEKGRGAFEAAASEGLRCAPAPPGEAELAEAVREQGARHVVVGVERYRGELYRALPRGGVVSRFGVGHDGIDKGLATAAGLLCTNTPGALDDSVAEHALALMLCAARDVAARDALVRRGAWEPRVGSELRGKRLAVIGCGAIGCRVAEIAAFGFGMEVVGCKRRAVDEAAMARRHGFARIVLEFAAAVAEADYVSLHIPSGAETRHFIDAARLGAMPAKAWLINTARGAVVDESALYDALAAGALAGAALDVFAEEPYVPQAPGKDLRTLPNVVLTPHVGSSTAEACRRMAERALRNIALAERGEFAAMDLLNPEVLGGGPGVSGR